MDPNTCACVHVCVCASQVDTSNYVSACVNVCVCVCVCVGEVIQINSCAGQIVLILVHSKFNCCCGRLTHKCVGQIAP